MDRDGAFPVWVIGILLFIATLWLLDRDRRARYVRRAMRGARYEQLEDGSWYGEIPGFAGVWADADTRRECQIELESVLDGWLRLRQRMGLPLPSFETEDLAAA